MSFNMCKPVKGDTLINLSGNTIGKVVRVEGGLCYYTNNNGEDDLFIWKSSHGLNRNVSWRGKQK